MLRFKSPLIALQLQANNVVINLFLARLLAYNVAISVFNLHKALTLYNHYIGSKIHNLLDVANTASL